MKARKHVHVTGDIQTRGIGSRISSGLQQRLQYQEQEIHILHNSTTEAFEEAQGTFSENLAILQTHGQG